jgi:hypothetical protein
MVNGRGRTGPAKKVPAKKAPAKKAPAKKPAARKAPARRPAEDGPPGPMADRGLDVPSQPFLDEQLHGQTVKKGSAGRGRGRAVGTAAITEAAGRIRSDAPVPLKRLPDEILQSVDALKPRQRTLHGAKFSLAYFPGPALRRPCADMFGYMSLPRIRAATQLPFTAPNQALLEALGKAMAAPGRDAPIPDSTIDGGMTYVGQFVDHDITLDVSSSLNVPVDANTIHNMRSPALDLDSLYGSGPALDPFLYDMPGPGVNPTAIKMQLGTNMAVGPGGPGGPAGFAGMVTHADRDVPRLLGPSHTAIIGDPRNDENLIIVQFHHAMLRFHNAVVDSLLASGFSGDIFVEAKRIVTHHYQWAVVNDFLTSVCGGAAVASALASVSVAVNSAFRMPVEVSVAAYRFGHSMIRDTYWLNFNFPFASLGQVFQFNRNPNLPILSNWIVDLNAFFQTGVPVPIFNKARKIDTGIANGLASLPGLSGMMAELAMRNLLRGLALGLPSGQGMAKQFGVAPLTAVQLTQGLPPDELNALTDGGNVLLKRTPLWYYVLRESAVLHNGDQLGPVGGRIIAETFVRILQRDPDSFVNVSGGFTPFLPSAVAGTFTFADLVAFSGMNLP